MKAISFIKWVLVILLYSVFYGSITVVLFFVKLFGNNLNWWLVGLSFIISSWLMFPILWLFRDHITKNKTPILYVYFDSSEGSYYGDDNWLNERNLKKNFVTAYKWNVLRNIAWNFWLYFKVKQGSRVALKIIDETNYTDYRENIYLPCQIKTNNGNFGHTFNAKHSILGKRFVIYKVGKTVYWNWSKAYEKSPGVFIEWELGYNDKRYLLNRNRKVLKT